MTTLPSAEIAELMVKLTAMSRGQERKPPPPADDLQQEVAIALGAPGAAFDLVGGELP